MISEEKLDEDNVIVFFVNKQAIEYNVRIESLEESITQQLASNPNDITLLMIQGQIQYKFNNDFIGALNNFKKVLELDPLNIDCRLEVICSIQNRRKELLDSCQVLIDECFDLDSSYWRVYFLQGMQYNLQEKKHEAIQILNQANQMFPNNLWIMVLLSQVLVIMNDASQKESLQLLDRALQFKQFSYEVLTGISIIYCISKQAKQAELYLNKVINLNKNSAVAIGFLAILQRTVYKNKEKSLELSKQALQINPQSVNSLFNISYQYFTDSKFEESLKHLKQILKLTTENRTKIYERICDIYFYDLYQMDKAIYYSYKIRKDMPNNQFANLLLMKVINSIHIKTIEISHEEFELSQMAYLNSYIRNREEDNEHKYVVSYLNQIY